MKRNRVWVLLALAAVALLASKAPVFHDTGATDKAATKVFDSILAQRYPQWTVAFRECVASPQAQHDVCWAEIHRTNRYRQIEIGVDLSTPSPVPSASTTHTPWTRKPIQVAYPAGHGVANSPAYDWRYLMNVNAGPGSSVFDAETVAGVSPGLFTFHCSGTRKSVTCRNVAGDSLTYTPASFG